MLLSHTLTHLDTVRNTHSHKHAHAGTKHGNKTKKDKKKLIQQSADQHYKTITNVHGKKRFLFSFSKNKTKKVS